MRPALKIDPEEATPKRRRPPWSRPRLWKTRKASAESLAGRSATARDLRLRTVAFTTNVDAARNFPAPTKPARRRRSRHDFHIELAIGYLRLAVGSGFDGVYATQAQLAELLHCDERHVRTVQSRLVERGVIAVVHQFEDVAPWHGGGRVYERRQLANVWALTPEARRLLGRRPGFGAAAVSRSHGRLDNPTSGSPDSLRGPFGSLLGGEEPCGLDFRRPLNNSPPPPVPNGMRDDTHDGLTGEGASAEPRPLKASTSTQDGREPLALLADAPDEFIALARSWGASWAR